MGNRRKIHGTENDHAERLYQVVTKYVTAMKDEHFDLWLKQVVTRRAEKGSIRAQEMLDFEAGLDSAPVS